MTLRNATLLNLYMPFITKAIKCDVIDIFIKFETLVMNNFMKKTITLSTLFSSVVLFAACSSNPTTTMAVQKENSLFEVTGLGKTQVISKNNAITAANKTCGSRATPIIVDEQSAYNGALKGVVDEKTGQLIQAAANVIGNIAGKSAGLSQDDDYQTTLTFRCQAK